MRRAVRTDGSHGGGRAFGARALACAMLVALALAAVLCASASAYSQRGHEFSGSFPEAGQAPALNHPSSVAVNETTGDVYVVDSSNNRVVVYDKAHTFLAAWGYGVKDGGKEFQVCTVAAECKPGLAGHKAGQLELAGNIAVDNSSSPSAGDVYVEAVQPGGESEVAVVDKFSGADPTNPVLLQKFTHGKEQEKFEAPNGIAVGPDGTLYVSNEEDVFAFSSELPAKSIGTYEVELGLTAARGFALAPKAGPAGGFYMGQFLNGEGSADVIAKLFAFEEEKELAALPLVEALDTENSTGVASDYNDEDAYVDHGKTVAAFDSKAQPIQTFGEEGGTEHISEGAGLTVDSKTGEVLVADAAANRIDVFKLEEPGHPPRIDELSAAATSATTTTLEGQIDPAGSPTEYAFRYSPGTVPPANQPCELPCVQIPATPGSAGTGFGDVPVAADVKGLAPLTTYHYKLWAANQANPGTFVEAEGTLKTLTETPGETLPDSRQWQQVSPVVKNAGVLGFQEPSTSTGGVVESSSDGSAITYLAAGAIRGTCAGEEEPEGVRSPEVTQMISRRGGTGWCSADIETKHNAAEGLTPGGAGEYREFSEDLSLALVEPYGKSLIENPPLSSEATERTPYLRHNLTCAAAPGSCFEPLATSKPPNNSVTTGAPFGTKVTYVAATPDMSHVVLASQGPALTSEPVESTFNLYVWNSKALKLLNTPPSGETSTGFAELGWSEGQPKNVRHAISRDGSRYIWSTGVGSSVGHLYMRDINRPRSVRLDVKNPAIPEGKGCTTNTKPCEHARFQIASSDGKVVYFTSEQRLTQDSGAGELQPDLYVCNVTEEEVEGEIVPTGCRLTDLTPKGAGGAPGLPQGLVLGAGENGQVAYFVADGPLGGQKAGTCQSKQAESAKALGQSEALPVATECTLFVVRYDEASESWQPAEAVASLSAEEEFDWSRPTRPADAGELVSRVSPNGEWLSFMSDRNLTGYDTRRLANNRPVEEVYLYNERTGELHCTSCNPTGARPQGIFDTAASGEGIGLLVDRPLLWSERWISGSVPSGAKISANEAYYQSRALGDNGRVFFDSSEGLVSQDKNGKEDPYEYEPAGVGGCTAGSETFVSNTGGCVSLLSDGKEPKESIFLDASLSGDDVFFITTSELTASDTEHGFDLYDASVCGVSGRPNCLLAPAASPPPCESSSACRGATNEPVFAPLPSGGSSANNTSAQHEVLGSTSTKAPTPIVKKPLTRAQKLAKALKACHKLKSHKKRVACERSARKKYGVKKKAKKSATHGTAGRGR
jgi:DNA-binding beta-propeller fold protein YncE